MVDVEHDRQDAHCRFDGPALVLWGARGTLPRFFHIRAIWRRRLVQPEFATIDGGHFFIDEQPEASAAALLRFLDAAESGERMLA